ncbi:MAG: hypothetical protein A2Z68_02075 [Candidatus Nealsonbacteria bacterium RBG_13_38_11]|uniref:Uncharacterized protein n=1 Tax=Candidatus Nealsonbacteria bacterium RBG_13_38_11 TaxID=1801662 RepID=A0A1G2DZE7_9BACT|nr:MAG: hypothetical protein A2Z68_02075 [Candidatus Nealsonbacteria bacterium RBG_13_38_11]HXK32256.1 hypothetical protein [Candidatus Paceibacterota bacterium]
MKSILIVLGTLMLVVAGVSFILIGSSAMHEAFMALSPDKWVEIKFTGGMFLVLFGITILLAYYVVRPLEEEIRELKKRLPDETQDKNKEKTEETPATQCKTHGSIEHMQSTTGKCPECGKP